MMTAVLLCSVASCQAWGQTDGTVRGVVRDQHGIPQLGVLVELFGPQATVVATGYTDDHGRYMLSLVRPGHYQLRASAALFLPAPLHNLRLTPGSSTLADFTLRSLFDTDGFFPVSTRTSTEPADDWRWTLQSSTARPLLRFSDTDSAAKPEEPSSTVAGPSSAERPSPFDSRYWTLEALAGSDGLLSSGVRQRLSLAEKVSDNFDVRTDITLGLPSGPSAAPAMALRLDVSRHDALSGGQLRTVAAYSSMPQIFAGAEQGLEAFSLATGEQIVLGDLVTIDAGTLLTAEKLASSHVSTAPFLRIAAYPGANIIATYRYATSAKLQQVSDLANVHLEPAPLATASGEPFGEVGNHQELAFQQVSGEHKMEVTFYRDSFRLGTVEGVLDSNSAPAETPMISENQDSRSFITPLPGYRAYGLSAFYARRLSHGLEARMEADFGTALTLRDDASASIVSLSRHVAGCSALALSGAVSGTLPSTHTSFTLQYHWQAPNTLTLVNSYDQPQEQAYAGLHLKQQLWSGRSLRQVNAVLEATNLLQEGYQPLIGPDGRTLYLAQVPRALQAGLAFSF